jgi:mannose-1-phosphate guanylyltransferase
MSPPRAMILAAGFGTRLRPLTDELPKPLLPVGDRPAIAHIAGRLAAAGIQRASLNTHHLAEAFSAERLAGLPVHLTVIHEPRILGTAGGVANAAPHLGAGDAIVWNGDILADLDVRALFQSHAQAEAQGGALATLAVAPRPRGEGTVGLDARGAVVRLRGERFGEEASGGDFLGIQVLGAALRRKLPEVGCLVGDGYLPALREGAFIAAAPFDGDWGDIGSVAAYLDENVRWLRSQTGRPAHCGEGARVEASIELSDSVVGAFATVTGRGALRRVVVWPLARAVAPLEDAVVTTGGLVVRAP